MPLNISRTALTGYEALCWRVSNRATCVEYVGEILRANASHVERVLRALEPLAPRTPRGRAIDEAIARLSVTNAKEIEHRDGWLFQMISWVAAWTAHRGTGNDFVVTLPQPRPADKGFDHLLVWLSRPDLSLSAVVIGEDKATVSPRETIRTEVWPTFSSLENEDRELECCLTALLREALGRDSIDVDRAVDGIIRNHRRGYRVAVTCDEKRVRPKRLPKLFNGFVGSTPRATHRYGEAFVIDDVRPWMQTFSNDVVTYLQSRGAGGSV